MFVDLPGQSPVIADSAWIAPNATLIGRVVVHDDASVWYGVVLRGDSDLIEIGAGSNVQDNSVLHTDSGLLLTIGRNVVIGHNAVVHGATVGDGVLIGMGAILLNRCRIGEGSVIGAGAVVSEGTVIPPGSLVLGVPGKVRRETTDAEREQVLLGAAGYVARAALHRDGRVRA